ncbi:MAG: heat-shock protein [Candidatus Tectimicrobiota bacterium]|nr:MAG: heat-shock protein [Candidatus Tectomicrobia bacterium]
MVERTVATQQTQQVAPTAEGTRERERYVAPPVDIYETPEGLVVMADLPGVSKDDLEVRVDNHVLTIRGRARPAVQADPIYREYELVNFFRQFELTEKIDESRITAELKHGVLTLHLPKAEEAKPRKIEVKVA